jgi:DNA-binding NarL/FixJ family response regulator
VLGAPEPGGSTHKSRFEFLTCREQQVLTALMDGTTAVQIARQCFMSPSTVRHHIRSILLKLNVNSQLAAVVAAYQAGWPLEGTTPKVNARLGVGASGGPEQIQRLSG